MTRAHRTIIVTAAIATNIRKLSQMLDRSETDGMFTTALSATGNPPATHFISSGQVPQEYIDALASATTLEAAARAAYLRENIAFPYTTPQIAAALASCTISDGTITVLINSVPTVVPEGPHELLARLGFRIIQVIV